MVEKGCKQCVVLSSYGNEIYKGNNVIEARELGRNYGDKHTLYILTLKKGKASITIEKLYENGNFDSSQHMELGSWDVKHFKTLINFLK